MAVSENNNKLAENKVLILYMLNKISKDIAENNLFMKLVEEMGEVAEVINKKTGRKADSGTDLQTELGKELTDVIHYAVAIAAVNGLDLNKIILEKDRAAAIKYNHKINLEDFISEAEKNNV